MKFWIPWAIDMGIAIIALYFFFIGLADGSVSSFNIGIWLLLLLGLGGIIGASLWLKTTGHPVFATALLLLLAVPGGLYGLFLLLLVFSGPRWN